MFDNTLTNYIKEENKIGTGKEVSVYKYEDKVIKLFHKERLSNLERISDEGLTKLLTLNLQVFNKPLQLIYDENNKIVGYTEKYLEEEGINLEWFNYDLIKEDLQLLSDNGFTLNDIFYNYIFSGGGVYFTDLTSYQYMNTSNEFLKQQIYKKNVALMNQFLVGFLVFDAFRKGNTYEYRKMYLASCYCEEHCKNCFYGDYLKEERKR